MSFFFGRLYCFTIWFLVQCWFFQYTDLTKSDSWQKKRLGFDTQKAKPVSQTSPAFIITAKEYGIESQVSFEHNADAVPGSIKLKLLRYQTNANWGPQKRPDKAIKEESNKKQRIE